MRHFGSDASDWWNSPEAVLMYGAPGLVSRRGSLLCSQLRGRAPDGKYGVRKKND